MGNGGSGVAAMTKYCAGCYKNATDGETICSGCGGTTFKEHEPIELGAETSTHAPQGPASMGCAGNYNP